MDEKGLSWRARLAKSNINILDIHDDCIFLEFTYHPKVGIFKWCKTYYYLGKNDLTEDEIADHLLRQTLRLRKELEG